MGRRVNPPSIVGKLERQLGRTVKPGSPTDLALDDFGELSLRRQVSDKTRQQLGDRPIALVTVTSLLDAVEAAVRHVVVDETTRQRRQTSPTYRRTFSVLEEIEANHDVSPEDFRRHVDDYRQSATKKPT